MTSLVFENLRSVAVRERRRVDAAKHQLAAEIAVLCRDCATRRDVRKRVAQYADERRLGFGFVEIVALINLVIALWKIYQYFQNDGEEVSAEYLLGATDA